MKRIVSKESVRELTKRKLLPRTLFMFVAGGWLFDLFKANSLDIKLWEMTYWVRLRSLDRKRMVLHWEAR